VQEKWERDVKKREEMWGLVEENIKDS